MGQHLLKVLSPNPLLLTSWCNKLCLTNCGKEFKRRPTNRYWIIHNENGWTRVVQGEILGAFLHITTTTTNPTLKKYDFLLWVFILNPVTLSTRECAYIFNRNVFSNPTIEGVFLTKCCVYWLHCHFGLMQKIALLQWTSFMDIITDQFWFPWWLQRKSHRVPN